MRSAEIIVKGPSLPAERLTATDREGHFRVLALPVGIYVVTIRHAEYQEVTCENISIHLGRNTTLGEILLTPKSIEMPEVIVMAPKPFIDPTSTTVGTNLNAEDFELLPTERSFRSIIGLAPQANVSYLGDETNIAGSTGLENAYFIDGVNVTDGYTAASSTNLPYNFVKEIEVKVGGYEAEFGRSQGGIVNVITYSGGNNFSSNVFGFFTGNNLAADSRLGYTDLKTGDFAKYDGGFSLGGPIKRNKLWFFAAYDANSEQEDIAFEGLGVRTDKKISNLFAGKLTWQATSDTNLVFTVFGDPTTWDRIGHNFPGQNSPSSLANPDPFLGKWEEGGVNFSIKADCIVGKDFLLESTFYRQDARRKAEPATQRGRQEALFLDLTSGIWSGGYGNMFDHHTIRTGISAAGTYFLGPHIFKVGIQYEDNFLDEEWLWQSDQVNGAGMVIKYADNFYLVLPLDFQVNVRNRVLSLYSQGSFSLHPRFRLNIGLRWEGQYLKGVDSGLKEAITDQYQPRVGFVYQVGELGSQEIIGSAGRFYEQIPNLATSFYYGPLQQDIFSYGSDPFTNPDGEKIRICCDIANDDNLVAQHYDEFTLGYEKQFNRDFKIGVRGIFRYLRDTIQDAVDPVTGGRIVGNPGRGQLAFLPKPRREYKALEITAEKLISKKLYYLASYVLSRNYGNYTGLFDSDHSIEVPHGGVTYDFPEQFINGTGLLPNDRTHNFKFSGYYKFDSHLSAGTTFVWQSGTPLNELTGFFGNPIATLFLRPRGTAGRTPSIWDLNLGFTYGLHRWIPANIGAHAIVEVLHVFGQRKPVNIDQQHYLLQDENGNQIGLNPNYLRPLLYQPPMTIRLGFKLTF